MTLIDVYCHTSPSGKHYVGYSKLGMAARWRRHVEFARAGSQLLLHRAIRAHGETSFRHELLEQCDTEAGAKRAEQRWIASRSTMAPRGYNATAGGEGMSPCPEVSAKLSASWPDERRAATSELTTQRNQGNTHGRANRGSKRSAETRALMAEKARGHARHVTPHTNESKAKMAAATREQMKSPERRAACGIGTRGKPWSAARCAAQGKKRG